MKINHWCRATIDCVIGAILYGRLKVNSKDSKLHNYANGSKFKFLNLIVGCIRIDQTYQAFKDVYAATAVQTCRSKQRSEVTAGVRAT